MKATQTATIEYRGGREVHILDLTDENGRQLFHCEFSIAPLTAEEEEEREQNIEGLAELLEMDVESGLSECIENYATAHSVELI